MLIKLYRAITQAFEVLMIFIYTFNKWPFNKWADFWTTSRPETVVSLKGIDVAIRTKTFFSKSADISMAYECIARDDYHLYYLDIRDKSSIIDIGAHIGSFSLAAAKRFPGAKILSFEPSPSNYTLFRKNIGINKFKKIKPFNNAVSSKEGEISFYIDSINSAANSIYNSKGIEIKVPSITLKKIFNGNKISKCSFMKLDCEGAEYDILLNAPDEILEKIDVIAIEYHSPKHFGIKNVDYNVQNLVKRLELAGFRCSLRKMKHYQGVLVARRWP